MDPDSQAVVVANGTDPTVVILRTSQGEAIEETVCKLPTGISTELLATYELKYQRSRSTLSVNGIPIGANTVHLPDKYDCLDIVFMGTNSDTVASDTTCEFDYVDLENFNEVATNATSRSSWDGRQEVRITPALNGARLHLIPIYFKTADSSSLHNVGPERALTDITYTMLDADEDVTTDPQEAVATLIDFEPEFNYEIMGGSLLIDPTLIGGTSDAWWGIIVGVPDLPSSVGGSVPFSREFNLEMCGTSQEMDGVATTFMLYHPLYHTGKIRAHIKHPVGASKRFQFFLRTFW
jgi:hypothetical protein